MEKKAKSNQSGKSALFQGEKNIFYKRIHELRDRASRLAEHNREQRNAGSKRAR